MTDELETRLKRLQRQNLFLGVFALASVAVLGLVQLRASRHLRVVSEDGKSELQLEPEKLSFVREGKIVLTLEASASQTALVARTRDDTADFILTPEYLTFRVAEKPTATILGRGKSQNRGFGLFDDSGTLRSLLALSFSGAPVLRLTGKSPDVVTDLAIDDHDEQRLAMTRGQDQPVATVRNGGEWTGCAAVRPDGLASVRLVTNGDAEVLLEDAAGHRRTISAVP